MAWLNPPTEKGLSPKCLVYYNKFDTSEHVEPYIQLFSSVTDRMSFLLIPTEFVTSEVG